jgi:putative ABC transport system ATP-binding protein
VPRRQYRTPARLPTRSIYRFVLHYSLPDQIYLVVVTLLSFPFLYLSLELPKLIINDAIGRGAAPRG